MVRPHLISQLLGHRVDRRLAGPITYGCIGMGCLAGRGRYIDDGSRLSLCHVGEYGLTAVEYAVQVDSHHPVPLLLCQFQKGNAAVHACVVHQYINFSEGLHTGGGKPGGRTAVRDIPPDHTAFYPQGFYPCLHTP